MSELLRQSTVVTVLIGPFIDDTDGKTAETGLTIAQADVRLSKNAGNMAQKTEATSCTHDELGQYTCPLDETDTGTLGKLKLMVHQAGSLQVWHNYLVVPANVYDTLVLGTDVLTADVTQIGGAAQSATDLKDLVDTGYNPTTHKVAGVVLADTTTAVTNGVSLADDAITSAKYDESTAFPVKSVDTGVTQIARVGADGDTLEDISDEIAAIGGGAGAITWTHTVTITGTSTPIADVNVWVTTDVGGSNVVAAGETNSSGVVTFYLDAGDYYFWCQKAGVNFTNPDAETVS